MLRPPQRRPARIGRSLLAPLVGAGAVVAALVLWWAWPLGDGGSGAVGPPAHVDGHPPGAGEVVTELEEPLPLGRNAAGSAPEKDVVSKGAPIRAPQPEADGELLVRMLDHHRTPVEGVQLEWWLVNKDGQLRKESVERPSDVGGLIAVPQPDRYLDAVFHPEQAHFLLSASIARVGLGPALPFDELAGGAGVDAPCVLWFDDEPARGRPIDLELPPTGAVRVTWDAIDGGLGVPIHPAKIILRRADAAGLSRWRRVVRGPLEGGEVVISPVGLGWQVIAEQWLPELANSSSRTEGPGPTAADRTATIHVPPPPGSADLVHVRGVVVDPSGRPIQSKQLMLQFGRAGGAPHLQVRTPSDGQGRFSLEAPGDAVFGLLHVDDRSRKPKRAGKATVGKLGVAETVLDVGEVTLHLPEGQAPWRPLVSGRVVDSAGQPVGTRGTHVSVEVRARSWNDKPRDPERWVRVARVKVDSDGRFSAEARVELHDQLVRVTPYNSDYRRIRPVEVPAGTRDLQLTLERGHAVRVTVEADAWAAVSEAVTLRFTGQGRDHQPSLTDFLDNYGGRFGGLEPGTYRLEVRLQGGDWVLAERRVEVYGDVDLGRIDVRGTLGVCMLTVLDGSGAPAPSVWMSVSDVATGVAIDTSVSLERNGHATLLVPLGVDEVLVRHPEAGEVRVTSDWFVEPTVEQLLADDPKFERHEVTLRR